MGRDPATAGVLLRRSFELLQLSRGKSLAACALLASISIADEMLIPEGYALTMGHSILSLILQYEITYTLLSGLGLLQAGYRPRRFLAILGMGILSGVAILLGLILLVVPGIILLVRWFIAVPVLVGEEAGVIESLQRSWAETSGRFLPILGTIVAIYAPVFLAAGVSIFAYDDLTGSSWPVSVITNVVIMAGTVVGWHAAVAIYADGRQEPRLAEVFA